MGYPVGPLLKTLAGRIRANLDYIDERAPIWGSKDQNDAPFSDTQLLISLLGVLVFPAERSSSDLGKLLTHYGDLQRVVHVVWKKDTQQGVEITSSNGEAVRLDPYNIEELPKLLRNSVAHFNMRPIDKEGRFAGVRIWNRDRSERLTFIADVDFNALRDLARNVLDQLSSGAAAAQMEDPLDPIDEALSYSSDPIEMPRAPRLNDVIWRRWLDISGNDSALAQRRIVAVLKMEADRLMAT